MASALRRFSANLWDYFRVGLLLGADSVNHLLRRLELSGLSVSTVAGSGSVESSEGVGASVS